jgi:hypothetical protein
MKTTEEELHGHGGPRPGAGRKPVSADGLVPLNVQVAPGVKKDIETYRARNHLQTRTDAVRELLEAGLDPLAALLGEEVAARLRREKEDAIAWLGALVEEASA